MAMESVWKEGFLVVADQHCLNFINTRPTVNGQSLELLPDWSSVLRWFRAAGLLNGRSTEELLRTWWDRPEAATFVRKLREFRELLRTAVYQIEAGKKVPASTVAAVNQMLAAHPMISEVDQREEGLGRKSTFTVRQPEDLLAPIAQSALEMLTDLNQARIRKCDSCVLHFYDGSKGGLRRWCSMQICGNRSKVAAYAARQRQTRRRSKPTVAA